MPAAVRNLPWISRGQMAVFAQLERRLLAGLEKHELLRLRVARLRTIPGVGLVLALTHLLPMSPVCSSKSAGATSVPRARHVAPLRCVGGGTRWSRRLN